MPPMSWSSSSRSLRFSAIRFTTSSSVSSSEVTLLCSSGIADGRDYIRSRIRLGVLRRCPASAAHHADEHPLFGGRHCRSARGALTLLEPALAEGWHGTSERSRTRRVSRLPGSCWSIPRYRTVRLPRLSALPTPVRSPRLPSLVGPDTNRSARRQGQSRPAGGQNGQAVVTICQAQPVGGTRVTPKAGELRGSRSAGVGPPVGTMNRRTPSRTWL
jgi:hypothetical protein